MQQFSLREGVVTACDVLSGNANLLEVNLQEAMELSPAQTQALGQVACDFEEAMSSVSASRLDTASLREQVRPAHAY